MNGLQTQAYFARLGLIVRPKGSGKRPRGWWFNAGDETLFMCTDFLSLKSMWSYFKSDARRIIHASAVADELLALYVQGDEVYRTKLKSWVGLQQEPDIESQEGVLDAMVRKRMEGPLPSDWREQCLRVPLDPHGVVYQSSIFIVRARLPEIDRGLLERFMPLAEKVRLKHYL